MNNSLISSTDASTILFIPLKQALGYLIRFLTTTFAGRLASSNVIVYLMRSANSSISLLLADVAHELNQIHTTFELAANKSNLHNSRTCTPYSHPESVAVVESRQPNMIRMDHEREELTYYQIAISTAPSTVGLFHATYHCIILPVDSLHHRFHEHRPIPCTVEYRHGNRSYQPQATTSDSNLEE